MVHVKQAWVLTKTTQCYSKFEAVNLKYEKQTLVNVKAMWPPTVTHSILENWIYPRSFTFV